MITYGNIYIITKNFEAALDFYRKLFERDTACQNKTRYAIFQMDGLGLSIMNGEFDEKHPDEVEKQGEYIDLYDNMKKIMGKENCGKVVINLCTDDLKKEHQRIQSLEIGSDLTEIRYIYAGTPYWYFMLKDLDGNTIEITENYDENGDEQRD